MHDCRDHYKYIARYVDDLAIVSKNPQAIIDILTEKYKLKLKGTGHIGYHLGCNFYCNSVEVLCMSPKVTLRRWLPTMK